MNKNNKKMIQKIMGHMLLMMLVAIIIGSLVSGQEDSRILLGLCGVWMVVSMILYFKLRKPRKIMIYSVANGVMAGIAIAGYYTLTDTFVAIDLKTLAVLSIGCGITYLLYYYGGVSTDATILLTMMWVIIGIVSAFIGGFSEPHPCRWLMFLSIIGFMVTIALWVESWRHKELQFHSIVSLYSMLMFSGVFYLVLTILSEGDSIDLLTAVEWDKKSKSRTHLRP